MTNLIKRTSTGNLAERESNSALNFPTLSTWFDDLFSNDLSSLFSSNFNKGISIPKVNIKDNTDAFVIEMAVPGMKKSDFDINLENKMLSISTEKEESKEETEDNFTRREFGYSSFKRTFTLPDSVEDNKIEANYNDGILRVNLPKREEAKEKPAKTIKIS